MKSNGPLRSKVSLELLRLIVLCYLVHVTRSNLNIFKRDTLKIDTIHIASQFLIRKQGLTDWPMIAFLEASGAVGANSPKIPMYP